MHDVAVEAQELGAAFQEVEQVGTHLHQLASAARRTVETAKQLLPPRLRGKVQIAGVRIRRLVAPGLHRLRQPLVVRAVMARQLLEECEPALGVEVVIAVKQLAGHRGAGGFAAARQQRFAQLQQFGRIVLAVGGLAAAQQRAAAFGNRREKV